MKFRQMEKIEDSPDPVESNKIFKQFTNIMLMLEMFLNENRTLKLNESLQGIDGGYTWDQNGDLKVTKFNTAKEALEKTIGDLKKCVSVLSKSDQKKANELLLKAQIYLAGA